MLKKPLWKNVDILGIGAIRVALKCLTWTLELWIFSGGFCAIAPLVFLKAISEEAAELIFHFLQMARRQRLLEVTEMGRQYLRGQHGFYLWGVWWIWSSLSIAKPVRMVQDISQEFMCLSKPEWRKRVSSVG